ncbi:MAG: hypothetical protein ACJAQT_004875 [Akkermansiaceae bacterium]|jgi:hypothetical protein
MFRFEKKDMGRPVEMSSTSDSCDRLDARRIEENSPQLVLVQEHI